MTWLRGLAERLGTRTKGQDSYHFDETVDAHDLRALMIRRAVWALRGAVRLGRHGIRNAPIFIGPRVTLINRRYIEIGQGVTLEGGAYLDGLSMEGLQIGRGSTIGRHVELRCSGVATRPGTGIRIGERVGISSGSFIGGQGGVAIEDEVIIGPGTVLMSEDHRFEEKLPIRLQGEVRSRITIRQGAWIGAQVLILRGVTVGEGAVVAGGAVVTDGVDARTIVGGVPARVIRNL